MKKNILQEFLDDNLNEVGTTTVRITKKTKIRQQSGISAMRLARDAGDPMYRRYKKYKKLYLDTRKKILSKWGRKGRREARRMLRG